MRAVYQCRVCDYHTQNPASKDLGQVQGNTRRFKDRTFQLWQCPECHSIVSTEPVDFRSIYSDYPLNERRLDIFAKITLSNLLRRLKKAGLKKQDRILDYGCGNGLFVHLLREKGYVNAEGYDPYMEAFSRPPGKDDKFDWVVANDVIEHCDDVHGMLKDAIDSLAVGGFLYVGTCETTDVNMQTLAPHVMRLHQPFHRVLLPRDVLPNLIASHHMQVVGSYVRSYMDTPFPFANYRFLDEMSKAFDHVMEDMLGPKAGRIFLKKPYLFLYAFAGYFLPSAYEPAVIARKLEGGV